MRSKTKKRQGIMPMAPQGAIKKKDGSNSSNSEKHRAQSRPSTLVQDSAKHTSSKTIKSGHNVDKYTGKKKGTLFSAAPQASKESETVLMPGVSTGRETATAPKPERKLWPKMAKDPDQSEYKRISKSAGKRKRNSMPESGTSSKHAKSTDAECETVVCLKTRSPTSDVRSATGKSNWERLKAHALATSQKKSSAGQCKQTFSQLKKKKHKAVKSDQPAISGNCCGIVDGKLVAKSSSTELTEVVALDCEMVGVGNREGRKRDALARAALVNDHGNVLADIWVRPKEKVTDYRFDITGIRPLHLKHGVSPEEASKRIHELVKNRTLVGHAVHNDIKVLALQGTVPRHRVRDTSLYPPLMGLRESTGKLYNRGLKHVVKDELGIDIQKGEHDPIQDARAALYTYHKHREVWELACKAGTLKAPGVRTSAKLTTGNRRQKKMRVTDTGLHPSQRTYMQTAPQYDSDDEFAPPQADAVARMKARLTGAENDDLADL